MLEMCGVFAVLLLTIEITDGFGQFKGLQVFQISALVFLTFAFIGPLSFFVIRDFSRRLTTLTHQMRLLAYDNTAVSVDGLDAHDEIGEMARALEVFKRQAVEVSQQRGELKTLNFRFNLALNNMGRGLSMFDANSQLVFANKKFQTLYGLPDELCRAGTSIEMVFKHRRDNAHKMDEMRQKSVEFWCQEYEKKIQTRQACELIYQNKNGRYILISYQPLKQGGCVAIHEDITEKKRFEEKITRLAQRDTLTGIANRHHFRQTLRQSCSALSGGGDQTPFALLLIDLDRFKEVNDTLGHPTGDALLRQVASRLRAAVRGVDTVARLGGDEFAILQHGILDDGSAKESAERVLYSLTEPYFVLGHHITIGASLGIARGPKHGNSHDEILKKADIALYRAKADGRGRVRFFEEKLEQRLRDKRSLEMQLQKAVIENEFELHYQPILSVAERRVSSFEALLRWNHPERGYIPPDQFIPLAEDIGLISQLGSWALRKACCEAVSWPEDVAVSVNLSAVQFERSDLYKSVQDSLAVSGLPPQRLNLEVTESLLLDNSLNTREILFQIRSDGIQIALDDFGTGYASLSYLRSFPFDKIKIDQSFIRTADDHTHSEAIVRAIVELANTLGMLTVAEGVETKKHLTSVRRAGCHEVQGFLFAKPVRA